MSLLQSTISPPMGILAGLWYEDLIELKIGIFTLAEVPICYSALSFLEKCASNGLDGIGGLFLGCLFINSSPIFFEEI